MAVKMQPKCPRVVEALAWMISRVIKGKVKVKVRIRINRIKPRFFMLAEAACCFVCPMMLIEKTRLPDFECVIH